jgi:hypothetical protein
MWLLRISAPPFVLKRRKGISGVNHVAWNSEAVLLARDPGKPTAI